MGSATGEPSAQQHDPLQGADDYGSNTGGTSSPPPASLGLRRSLSLVCCSTGCGCGVRLPGCGQVRRACTWPRPRPSCASGFGTFRETRSERPKATGVQETGTRRIPSILINSSISCTSTTATSLRQAVRGALEGDGQYETEYRVMSPDSTVHWIAARGRVEFDQNGKPRQLHAISIDITERRRAEDEARDLNGRLITAHEDERARLAHALHDDVTQRLALLAIDAGRRRRDWAIRSLARRCVQYVTTWSNSVRTCTRCPTRCIPLFSKTSD